MSKPYFSANDKKDLFLGYWHMLASGAPEPETEYKFAPPRRFAFDWCWPCFKVAVEVDGGDHLVRYSEKAGRNVAVGRHTLDSDKEKRNLATELGWRVFHYSPKMIETDPAGVVDQVLMTLLRIQEGKL